VGRNRDECIYESSIALGIVNDILFGSTLGELVYKIYYYLLAGKLSVKAPQQI
jgi:hypothetical protein